MGCLDNFWLEVMLCLIGETFDDSSKYVNGAVVSVRNKGDKIGMWLGDASQQSSIMTIGKMVKERLGIDARVRKTLHNKGEQILILETTHHYKSNVLTY